ncbi:NnrUfamily protein [Methylobacterium sp. 4-46]|uniref:NnrU family protein n=1 Tax=unclassified Methylobacterium TaxID=2615210 RepID=UPI000152C4B5|nr:MULTISPECIES: NnrU family protein [Methylobacterium]ACA17045.1 NnrUfamily protein [Methylobacterium sp. 4-46]WFT82734.1 NnrU family protein [Methylobacterium nodulans]
MPVLLLGLALFLGTHAFTMLRGPRAALIARVGEGPYKLGYSVLALVGLIVLGIGYGRYRSEGYIDIWSPPVWTRHLALLLVLVAFVAFAAAYLPGRIKGALKHPMLAGVKIWAAAHLLANGDLGSILLFGSILAWAVAARISVKRRDEVKAHAGPAAAPAGWRNDALAVGIGVVAWFVFARVLHPWLIGVAVWPGQA